MTETDTHEFEWRKKRITVTYTPNGSPAYEDSYHDTLAHLEIKTISPINDPLPITETGYRSYFTNPRLVEAFKGPVGFVKAMLEKEAQNPKWLAHEKSLQQLSLF